MDKIFIEKLLVRGIIGINEDEREKPQDIVISVEMYMNLNPAGKSDDIGKSVNYRTVVKQLMAHAENIRRYTVEALAEDIANICFEYSDVTRVHIRVEKPAAARFAGAVGIEIDRERS